MGFHSLCFLFLWCLGFVFVKIAETEAAAFPGNFSSSDVEDRIINGKDVKHGKYPFLALLTFPAQGYGNVKCGGSILNKRWILTAAHCMDGEQVPSSVFYIRSGVTNTEQVEASRQLVYVREFIKHERYDEHELENDIALLYLDMDLAFNEYVQPIMLPKDEVANGTGKILGWGAVGNPTEDDHITGKLQEANVHVISKKACQQEFDNKVQVYESNLCVKNSQTNAIACDGDSGGPFVQYSDGKPVVRGVLSWGSTECIGKPSVYTRVGSFLDWIRQKMSQKNEI